MSEIFSIYLSGGMQKFGRDNFDKGNTWRKYCKTTLGNYETDYKIKICNPNDLFNFKDEPKYASQKEVMNLGLYKLRTSNLVIVNFNDKWSLGTMSEIAIAFDRNIPVIGLNLNKTELHPWQECICERIFDNIDEMIEYVKIFYLL